MEISEYQIENSIEWNSIVRSFHDYEVFYLAEYSLAFMQENPENGIPLLLVYEDGEDRAINVVFRRDVALDPKMKGKIEAGLFFDLITPYGYGGFWGTVSNWEKLNCAYSAYCLDHHYVCEFVRFELFSDYVHHYSGEVESRTHNVVRSLEMPLDEMWMDFKQKVRKNVKKANSYHLDIIIESTDAHLDDFLRIYYSTMDRTNAEQVFFFSKEFFETLCSMKENIMFFHAVYEGKIVSTELVIYGSHNCYSYLGGTDAEYQFVRPNDFLKYEIIKWAKEKGLKNYILGGGYGSDDGIFQYKYALAPNGVKDFFIGRRLFDQSTYNMLKDLRTDEINEKYFPSYRS